jgi:hypothetical protein
LRPASRSACALAASVTADEYPLLYGPVIARIIFERAEATDAFIASVVAQWLAGRVG